VNREIDVVRRLSHPSILQYYEAKWMHGYLVIAMEYCPDSLLSWAERRCRVCPDAANRIFKQVALAVQYLHSRGIAHGDIKLDNVLIDEHGNAKLADFGYCSAEAVVQDNDRKGTLLYAAPELFRAGHYDPKCADVWSLGVLLFTLHTTLFPWTARTEEGIKRQICRGILKYDELNDPKIKTLVYAMTQVNPCGRISISEIIIDPALKDPDTEIRVTKTQNITRPRRKFSLFRRLCLI
jgi:serine/threonine protein kinase